MRFQLSKILVLATALAVFGCESSSDKGAPPQAAKSSEAAAAKPTEATATKTTEASQDQAKTDDVMWQGGTMENATEVALKDMLGTPDSYVDKAVRVEGDVTRVCQGMGCWIEIADGESSIIVKSLDHSISFPKDGTKHRAVVEGTLRVDAEDSCGGDGEGAAHHQQEGQEHECPKPKMLIEVRGAKLLAQATK